MSEDLLYQVALNLIPNIGPKLSKNLISYCGSAKETFANSISKLSKIPGIGQTTALLIRKDPYFSQAEKELKTCESKDIQILSYTDKSYPYRLKSIDSSPIILYKKGSLELNPNRSIGVIGTRTPTSVGKVTTEKLIEGIKPINATTISGFAYGVDTITHRKSLDYDVPTIAILGNALDTIYPSENRELYHKILDKGGAFVSEFNLGVGPEKTNFPMRNRIIAAMSDALIVVESKNKGGSMITAEFANDFNKDVFAIPGRPEDVYSAGCNALIKRNKAHLLETIEDLIYIMRWDVIDSKKHIQTSLFIDLSNEEQTLYELLSTNKDQSIDDLCYKTQMTVSAVSSLLLSMEFKGVIRSLPGKMYSLR
jgi:DNA processing protein